MGVESIHKNCYIIVVYDKYDPYGRMVCCYNTLEEAQNHIIYQKKEMGSNAYWNIMHIKDVEFLPAPKIN